MDVRVALLAPSGVVGGRNQFCRYVRHAATNHSPDPEKDVSQPSNSHARGKSFEAPLKWVPRSSTPKSENAALIRSEPMDPNKAS